MKSAEFLLLALHLGAVYKCVKSHSDSRVSYIDNDGNISYYNTKAGEWTEHLSPTSKSRLAKKKYRRHWPAGTIEKLAKKGLVKIVRVYSTHSPTLEVRLFGLSPQGVKVASKLASSLRTS